MNVVKFAVPAGITCSLSRPRTANTLIDFLENPVLTVELISQASIPGYVLPPAESHLILIQNYMSGGSQPVNHTLSFLGELGLLLFWCGVVRDDTGLSERYDYISQHHLSVLGCMFVPILSKIILMIIDVCHIPDSNLQSYVDSDIHSGIKRQVSLSRILFLLGMFCPSCRPVCAHACAAQP